MYFRNITKTLTSKVGILVLNFLLVVITARIWGAEGRGMISLLFANVAIIVTINNILSGSSVAFHAPKYTLNELIKPALLWILVVSFISSGIIFFIEKSINPIFLFSLTVLTSLINITQSVFVGKEKISSFNFFGFLLPFITLLLITTLYYFKVITSVNAYFVSYGVSYFLIWLVSLSQLKIGKIQPIKFDIIREVFKYGFKNELSGFMQFLTYRFSYFIILHYIGIKSLGIFSLGIALAESLWVVSGSIALVHYSKVLNSENKSLMVKLSNKSALLSLLVTTAIGCIVIFIPANWFSLIFGKDFSFVKHLFLYLLPGIVIQSFSTIYGHYLSATGNMRPLVIKSALGLISTVILALILIPRYGIIGACISTVTSYIISSAYIVVAFFNKTRK